MMKCPGHKVEQLEKDQTIMDIPCLPTGWHLTFN
jgi:hypothetical protein